MDGSSAGEGSATLETNNLDLAAYLLVRGREPDRVEVDSSGFRRFYYSGGGAKALAADFWADARVGVRTFVQARSALRRRG